MPHNVQPLHFLSPFLVDDGAVAGECFCSLAALTSLNGGRVVIQIVGVLLCGSVAPKRRCRLEDTTAI